jgi:tRNA(His) 5'-end guanylyltransferase
MKQRSKIVKQSMDKKSLGNRMKENYEKVFMAQLPLRMPVVLRLDGRAFHTFTRGLAKPYDLEFCKKMDKTAKYLCENIQGAEMAYVQSDEISILLHNYKRLNSEAWFNNEIQKMASISSGLASSYFTLNGYGKLAQFDSRSFVLPENEVCNYFIWRQQDWERNSIQMLAQSLYSHKELHGKNNNILQGMCFDKGENWNDLSTYLRRGRAVVKDSEGGWCVDAEIPKFTADRAYVEKLLSVIEE